jgi:uncharacterized protein (DUF58 family)
MSDSNPYLTPSFFRSLDSLKLSTRKRIFSQKQGGHRSAKRGHGLEFSEYRHYELGDSPRTIDWKLFSKTQKLYVKTFQDEQSLTLTLLFDTSQSMRIEKAKWNRVLASGAGLAYIGITNREDVFVHAPPTPPFRVANSLTGIYSALPSEDTPPISDFSTLLYHIQRYLPAKRSTTLTVILSDFIAPLEETYMLISCALQRSLEVIVLHFLGEKDIHPFSSTNAVEAVDSEDGSVLFVGNINESARILREKLNAHLNALRHHCLGRGVTYVEVPPNLDITSVFSKALVGTGLVR